MFSLRFCVIYFSYQVNYQNRPRFWSRSSPRIKFQNSLSKSLPSPVLKAAVKLSTSSGVLVLRTLKAASLLLVLVFIPHISTQFSVVLMGCKSVQICYGTPHNCIIVKCGIAQCSYTISTKLLHSAFRIQWKQVHCAVKELERVCYFLLLRTWFSA